MTQDPSSRDPFASSSRDPFAPSSAAAAPDAPTAPFPAASLPPAAPVPPPVVRARRSRASGIVNVLLGVAVVVAVGGVAFAAGRATAPASAASNGGFGTGRFGNGNGGFGPAASGAPGLGGGGAVAGGLAGGGLTLEGTVTAISADSITLQLANGQTVTIPVDAQTTWHEREAATPSAVTSGSTVIVQLQGGRGVFGGGNGNGNNGNGNGNGGPAASGQPGRTLPAASSITLAPTGS